MRYRNEFKRMDIFRCRHDSHEKFEYKVSAFHILERKKCFPNGCVYFRWRCKLFEKGKPCYRGYNYIGRLCFGCKYFLDEKVNNHPDLKISKEAFDEWKEKYHEFVDWIEQIKNKQVEILGIVSSVKPRFRRTVYPKSESLRLGGFQIAFSESYIGMDHLDDDCYAIVGPKFQDRHKLGAGAKIEFCGTVTLNRGRVLFEKIHRLEVVERSDEQELWNSSKAIVARSIATGFGWQPAKCLKCKFGVLADVEDRREYEIVERRQLYCLQGMPDPDSCTLVPGKSVGEDECQM